MFNDFLDMRDSRSDKITLMETVSHIENIFNEIKDSKKGKFDYDEIKKELSEKIIENFPDCKKNVPVRVTEQNMNSDLLVHFIVNSVPVCIQNNGHNMATGFVLNIMHVLACKYGISINLAYNKFEFVPLQNPQN